MRLRTLAGALAALALAACAGTPRPHYAVVRPPASAAAPKAVSAAAPAPPPAASPARTQPATEHRRRLRPRPSPAQVAAAPAPPSAIAPAQAARARALRSLALEDMNRGRIEGAVVLLRQAASLDPGDPLILADLERAERVRAAVRAR